jgi:uncharacterized protein (TIGR00251 family)
MINIVVTPKASSNRIVEGTGDVDFRVYVTTAPQDGKANKAVLKLLSKYLGVARTSLTLVRGASSRTKLVSIEG